MIAADDLPPAALALGLLTGLLTQSGEEVTLELDWFADPLADGRPSLANADQRLGHLAELFAAVLPPAADPPPVFEGAQWYVIPGADTPSPLCIIASPTGTELGLGALSSVTTGNVVLDLFAYLPLVQYGTTGAEFVVGDPEHPLEIGVSVATADGKGFTNGGTTFSAMTLAANLYFDPAAYTTPPQDGFFTLAFAGMPGQPVVGTYHSLNALTDEQVQGWIGQVIVETGDWLSQDIGDAPVSLGDILAAAGFLQATGTGYEFDIASLDGVAPQDIALGFVFGALDALSDADIPVPFLELPYGGLYATCLPYGDGTADYGLRLQLDVPVYDDPPAPEVDISLGSWLTGEEDATSWVRRSLGATAQLPDAGISVWILHQGPSPADVSFAPKFALSSVGLNVSGTNQAPLLDIEGVSLGGFELRAYLDEATGWTYGGAIKLDALALPLAPDMTAAAQAAGSNPVVSSLLAGSSGSSPPVNPAFSVSAAWVERGTLAVELYDWTGAPADTVVLPVQRSLGPVSVQHLGVGWVESTKELSLLIDGGVQVGTLNVGLSGLSVGMPVANPGDFAKYELDLDGLGIAFSAGEVELVAAFVKRPPDPTATPPRDYVEYDGEALISAGEFSITAVGAYAHVPAANESGSYSSLFIFGVLDGDLGGPEFFYVTGVAAGFGYNRRLLLPDQSSVTVFPLVEAATDPSTLGATRQNDGSLKLPDPATALQAMDAVVPPAHGEYWLSAGLRFTSFDLINSTALLVVEFGTELELALLGLSWISLPPPALPGAAAPVDRYAYAELGIEIKLLPSEGLFSATAILTENSFVIDPACKLTGGFAFYVWFGSNAHAGEFVLTLGGYHPDFQPPTYYPTVPRLGFDWPMPAGLSISGDAYFALTSSAVMAGGALSVLFASGDLHAWLNAHLDALIEWAPLHFEVDVGVSVGASVRVKLLGVAVTLKAELSADLTLWGPPTGGVAHIHWYVVSFTVHFGAPQLDSPAPLAWTNDDGTGFAQTLLPQAPGVHSVTVDSGLTGTSGDTQIVRTQYALSVTTSIPATQVLLGGHTLTGSATVAIRPMRATLSASVLTISITDDATSQPVEAGFDFESALVSLPAAKWGAPLSTPPEMNALLTGQLAGLKNLTPTAPTLTPQGAGALSLDVETAFTYETVDPQPPAVPLDPAAAPADTAPQPGTFATVAQTLAATATTRTAIFAALRDYGVDAGTDGELSLLAADPAAYLTAPPLVA